MESSTLDSTTTSSNIELSGKATHQNTIKSGTQQKTSTMQNTQSNDSSSATQGSPQWIHVTINRSSSTPPQVVQQEQHSHRPASDAQCVARNSSCTSPAYSGSPKRQVAHASRSWTDCVDDGCQIHVSQKQWSGWYPQFTTRSRQARFTHDHDWRQEMEANLGGDWRPQQPRWRRASRAHGDLTSWEPCVNDNCKEH